MKDNNDINIKQSKNNSFVDCLLEVTKELQKRNHIREFRKEFESEVPNFPFKQYINEKISEKDGKQGINDEDLKMEVYDDKDYDVEEIKFWNFMSKNKNIKPSIIRTVVYKVPETQYIVKKCEVKVRNLNNEKKEVKKLLNQTEEHKNLEVNPSLTTRTFSTTNEIVNSIADKHEEEILKENLLKPEQLAKKPKRINDNNDDIILIDESDDMTDFKDDDGLDKEKGPGIDGFNQRDGHGKDKKLGMLPMSHNIKKAKEFKVAVTKTKLPVSVIEETNKASRITRSRTSTSSKN